MKTRELLACNIKTFGSRILTFKPKELRRHIDRIATDLGETDTDALMAQVVDRLFGAEGLPASSSEEMSRVLSSLEGRIPVTQENEDALLRLMALCVTFLRLGMRRAVREHRLAERKGAGHHDGRHCDDPHCEDHGHVHGA
jgi:hypothetical protein